MDACLLKRRKIRFKETKKNSVSTGSTFCTKILSKQTMMKKKVKTGAQPPSSKKLKIQLKNLSAITRKTCLKKGVWQKLI